MEDGKRKEFRRLLTTLDANKETDQLGERDRALERARQVYKFQDVKKTMILPTLREMMVDLDHKGHLTRLQEKTPEKVRFDVQIQARTPKRGAVELSLHPTEGKLKVVYAWSTGKTHEGELSLHEVEAGVVADRLMFLLKGLL